MNTDEVTEMLDDITAGQPTVNRWESSNDSLFIATAPHKLVMSDSGDFIFEIRDPRTAREIAGALVAWATQRDGKLPDIPRDMRPNNGVWRTDWYRSNVESMTQVTKNRNLADLLKEIQDPDVINPVRTDIENAIRILREAGAE